MSADALHAARMSFPARAAAAGKLCLAWLTVSTQLAPERRLERGPWVDAFRAAGFLVDDEPRPRPWTKPLVLYRGAAPEHRDGVSWTPGPLAAGMFARASRHLDIPRSPGMTWTTTVEPAQVLAVIRYWGPRLGYWDELLIDTAGCQISRADDATQDAGRDFADTWLGTPCPPFLARRGARTPVEAWSVFFGPIGYRECPGCHLWNKRNETCVRCAARRRQGRPT